MSTKCSDSNFFNRFNYIPHGQDREYCLGIDQRIGLSYSIVAIYDIVYSSDNKLCRVIKISTSLFAF
jgi:hypothetical protein